MCQNRQLRGFAISNNDYKDNNGWDREGPRQRIFVTFKKVSYGVIAALIGKVKEMYCGIGRQGENGKTFPVSTTLTTGLCSRTVVKLVVFF